MAMLSSDEIQSMGFVSVGDNVQISDRATFYGIDKIQIGSNVRIDDFCVLAAGIGGIEIGSYVHIAVGASLIGAENITLSDFSGLSSRVSIYSSSDDYSGEYLTNPTVPNEYKNVKNAPVFIGRHVIVGSGSVILPGVRIEEGAAIGALSLVVMNCESFGIYSGNPLRRIKNRMRDFLVLEKRLLQSQ
jgi:dTDP-4-amino-4,6-dideoxy-D-glucose acyltransferase